MILRIVSILFSASDFKHAVCTPAMVLISQVLAQVRFDSALFVRSLVESGAIQYQLLPRHNSLCAL